MDKPKIFILLSLVTVLEGCMQMTPSAQPCELCPRTLADPDPATCNLGRTCTECVQTTVGLKHNMLTNNRTGYVHEERCWMLDRDSHMRYYNDSARAIGQSRQNILGCSCWRAQLERNSFPYVQKRPIRRPLTCSALGQWQYAGADGTILVTKAKCFGNKPDPQQSPIDIPATTMSSSNYQTSSFQPSYGNDIIDRIDYKQKDFTVHTRAASNPTVSANHLERPMKLAQFHGHWGNSVNTLGSEHLLRGMQYDAELHFVHWNEEYGTFANAVGKEGGLAVVGVFVRIGMENPNFKPFTDAIRTARTLPGMETTGTINTGTFRMVDPVTLWPANRQFYSYGGSLTTPDFKTCVAWTVLEEPIEISREQMQVLWDLGTDSFRAPQEILPETKIYKSQ